MSNLFIQTNATKQLAEEVKNQKIKQLVSKIEQERDTFGKIALVKQLDDEVSKFRKELITKFQRENK